MIRFLLPPLFLDKCAVQPGYCGSVSGTCHGASTAAIQKQISSLVSTVLEMLAHVQNACCEGV